MRLKFVGERLNDYVWGSVDHTELTLRPIRPWHRRWCDLRLTRENWDLRWKFSRDVNGRCYCPVGWYFRCDVAVAGWRLIVWLSHYGGTVPCPCDEAIEEWKATERTAKNDHEGHGGGDLDMLPRN